MDENVHAALVIFEDTRWWCLRDIIWVGSSGTLISSASKASCPTSRVVLSSFAGWMALASSWIRCLWAGSKPNLSIVAGGQHFQTHLMCCKR